MSQDQREIQQDEPGPEGYEVGFKGDKREMRQNQREMS